MVKVSKSKSNVEDKLVRMTFDAPASLRKAFKIKAALEDKDMKDIFCEFMKEYVKK
ncbi:MAG: hypothetical protein WCE22_00725 [Candidatus Aquirickettsiella gammari]|jgi:hypothetical protein